jgi:cysteine synthase B
LRNWRNDLPYVQCISAQPATGFHGIEGTKHMPTAIVPAIYDSGLADDNIWIETEDAYAEVRRMARSEALLVGISSGANLVAAREVGRRLVNAGERGVIVTILADSAYKYLSEPFWHD